MTTDYDTLRKLALEATPGPWFSVRHDDSPDVITIETQFGAADIAGIHAATLPQDDANAAFIAAANPQAVIGLLEIAAQSKRIDVLRAERDELREALQSLRDVAHMALSGDASGPDVEQQIMCADAALATARSPK